MKFKNYYIGLFIGAAVITSCDMNTEPKDVIGFDNGMLTMNDVSTGRDGLYSFLRSFSGGSFTGIVDLQSDLFIGTMQNGNSYLSFTTGNIQSNDGDVEGIWASLYSGLMQVNYFLERAQAFKESNELSEEDVELVDKYLAEAHFMRAYYDYLLMNYYCGVYDSATADNSATGIPLVTSYDPTGDRSRYPGRSTLAATYKLIEDDLNEAYAGINAFEKANSVEIGTGYLNSYTVVALQARVALLKGDYATAFEKSGSVIDSKLFELCHLDDYADMWFFDEGSELIFQPYGNSAQMSSVPATGTIYNQASPIAVKFAPSSDLIDSYDAKDVRLEAFIDVYNVDYNGETLVVPAFNKYCGNPQFNSGNTNAFKNLPKPFRTSEQYLIYAEAAYNLQKTDVANTALNELRAARIRNYTDVTYNGATLLQQIKDERAKELCGEGFRISDLRRWHQGFTRSGSYVDFPDMQGYIINVALQVSYTGDDYRYVWPIPSYEINTNPQLAGQQNPNY